VSPSAKGVGAVLFTAAAAALAGVWGLDARDLAGDEIHMLVGDPFAIAARSLDPRGGFVGHLPWSYWLRWGSLTVFGDAAWAWRAHALVGATLAAGLTAWLVQLRWGAARALAVGLLVGLSPILSFHAQDSSNYAWSAVSGALVLGGLWGLGERRARAGLWLGIGLLVGGLNDVYFVFPATIAAAGCVWLAVRDPTQRRAIVGSWLPALAVLGPATALFLWRLLESSTGGVVDVHADPPAPSELVVWLDVPWTVLRRFSGAYLAGYDGGRISAPWEVWAPVAFTGAAIVAAIRGRGKWPAAMLVAGLGLMLAVGLGFRVLGGRTFPHEPRVFLTLLPALACVWVAALDRLPRALAWGTGALLALSIGAETLDQKLMRSDMHQRAAAVLAAEAAPTDLVLAPDPRVRDRLESAGVIAEVVDCLPAGPLPERVVWWVRLQPADAPANRRACQDGTGEAGASREVLLDDHHLAAADTLGPPEHERNAASFLMPTQLERWAPGPPAPLPETTNASARLVVWGGAVRAHLATTGSHEPGGQRPIEGTTTREGNTLSVAVPTASLGPEWQLVLEPAVQIEDTLGGALEGALGGLLDPFRREVMRFEPVQRSGSLLMSADARRVSPFQDPFVQVGLRMARALLALLAVFAVLWRRRSTAPAPRTASPSVS
jgi:hypothetical protein